MLRSFHKFFILSILFLAAGCAQVVAPAGGPKDTVPPKPISYSPENKSIHFASKKISVKFNK